MTATSAAVAPDEASSSRPTPLILHPDDRVRARAKTPETEVRAPAGSQDPGIKAQIGPSAPVEEAEPQTASPPTPAPKSLSRAAAYLTAGLLIMLTQGLGA